ncbi:MAG: UDP-N-acetylglucosamine--N-acetylmuramyl-(pentapeptide) pyrophosphoryl-undecaprenol N-acetylglucosamine transferase [Patescibacteria group bacterium]
MKVNRNRGEGKNKIVLAGGHAATTALATVEELIRDEKWDIYWIGAGKAMEGKDVPTLESKIFPKIGIKSYKIISGRLQRKLTFWTLPSIIKIPFGFFHAMILLLKIRPKVILSFGGFAAFPVVVVGFFLRIPIVVHEQTSAAGRSNIFSAKFAKKIALSRKSSQKYFAESKSRLVGNPVMTQIAEIKPKEKIGKPPTVLIVGGSRGSQTINEAVLETLDKLVERYNVIHQTGFIDFEKIKEARDSLSKEFKEKYEIYKMIEPMDMDGVYKRADIVVSRAGANTVSEIIAAKIPTILIPIPWVYENEQTKNAEYAEEFGVARILNQKSLSGKALFLAIKGIEKDWFRIVESVKNKKSPDINAAKRLVNLLEDVVK